MTEKYSIGAALPIISMVTDRAKDPNRHKVKVCFFLGAGVDISSGGMSFTELKKQALENYLGRTLFDITLPEEIQERFDKLICGLSNDERAILIENLFRSMEPIRPSDSYKLLVLLAEVGGIDTIITTNFDMMLERAQYELGRDVFQVFSPGLARPHNNPYGRFEPLKKPYLKLHGDIGARYITLLTTNELKNGEYDASILELLNSTLKTHDVVFVGYSGYDPALAKIISDALLETDKRIYWCGPSRPASNASLYNGIKPQFVRINFDELMSVVAKPVLERPSLAATEPTYVSCLFDWRVDYCNKEYKNYYGSRSGKPIEDTFARRKKVEDSVALFLKASQPLAIITGPSGFGKTTIGVRLLKTYQKDPSNRVMLIRSRSLVNNGDIEQHIGEQLGGLGSREPFSLFRLERWLRERGVRLILYIDGVNEFSPDLNRCVQYFRNILRFCYFLPEIYSAIRVIATIRQETWNVMLRHLDAVQLSKTVWSNDGASQSFNTISCAAFSDEELDDALSRVNKTSSVPIDIGRFSPSFINQIRDPYLFRMLADAAQQGLPPIPSAQVYQRAFENKLKKLGESVHIPTLKDILASVALLCLKRQQDRFRETDIDHPELRGDVIRMMKDINVFVDAGDGFLQFDHDRTFEYFLALGFASNSPPHLETIDELAKFLHEFSTQSKPIAAARLYFQLEPQDRFHIIADSLQLLDSEKDRLPLSDRERLFNFSREVLIEMAEQDSDHVKQYLEDAIEAAHSGKVGHHQLRTVVQAAANLSVDSAIHLLARVSTPQSFQAQAEANIYAIDKIVTQYLFSGTPKVALLHDDPYAIFFADGSIKPWQKLSRLLGFAAQLGPDNTHTVEYDAILHTLNIGLNEILQESPWSTEDANHLCSFMLENCDRLLFNATVEGIKTFFSNPHRSDFLTVFRRLETGQILSDRDLEIFEPYIRSLSSDIEYHLTHLLFILSSLNNLEATLQLTEDRFKKFSAATSPVEIDFFQAIVVYLHVLHGLEYDEKRFGKWEREILDNWREILLFRPGTTRGKRRGFDDPFDQIFEDGFGVIYPYGRLLPSINRRNQFYRKYRDGLSTETSTQLPMYSDYLQRFLLAGQIDEALQILQALSSVIVLWPTEGLLSLRSIIGHPDPRIHRATIRILSEAYGRYPVETMHFLKTSGVAVSDDELIEIKIRQDARIGRRQIGEVELARVSRFILNRPNAIEKFTECIKSLLCAASFEDAISKILQILALIEPNER